MLAEMLSAGSGSRGNVYCGKHTFTSGESSYSYTLPFTPTRVVAWAWNGSNLGLIACKDTQTNLSVRAQATPTTGVNFTTTCIAINGNEITITTIFQAQEGIPVYWIAIDESMINN